MRESWLTWAAWLGVDREIRMVRSNWRKINTTRKRRALVRDRRKVGWFKEPKKKMRSMY
jgi:hypothetical protein